MLKGKCWFASSRKGKTQKIFAFCQKPTHNPTSNHKSAAEGWLIKASRLSLILDKFIRSFDKWIE